MAYHNRNLPADPDRAAAFVLADLTKPDGSYPPERVEPDYVARLTDAGIEQADRDYVLRSLTRHAVVLETAWLQIMGSLASPSNPTATVALTRAASRLHTDLMTTLGAIYKIRKDQREGSEPLVLAQDLALADAPPPPGLTTLERVQAEVVADDIFDAEFKPKPSADPLPSSTCPLQGEPHGPLVQVPDEVD